MTFVEASQVLSKEGWEYSIKVTGRDEYKQRVRIMAKKLNEIECEGFNMDT